MLMEGAKMGEDTGNRAAWQEAVVRAAAEASRLQPLAQGLFAAAALLIIGQYIVSPLSDAFSSGDGWMLREALANLVDAAPAVVLAWALWETHGYLGRLAKGHVWGAATTSFLGRVGDCLLWAAILSALVAPTLRSWILDGFHGFDWRLEAPDLVLAGLGLLLSLIGRVVRNVVEVAATLKAENDQIV
ncbi:MAG: hypothetical protein GC206_05605 [Alphaproteobacteria bacterium]|nr:hypothetical protein [Alphaproteobacteria bacterium]